MGTVYYTQATSGSRRRQLGTITREEAIAKGVLTLKELMEYDPEFLTRRQAQAPDLEPVIDSEAGTINSRWEENVLLYEVDDNGVVQYGRLYKREAPAINAALVDSERGLVGLNIQHRKAAGGLFAQPVMGFNLPRVLGRAAGESNEAAAVREALEENGVEIFRDIQSLGKIMVNPTSFISQPEIFVIDCDSSRVLEELDVSEGIKGAMWITPTELLDRISAGTHEGIRYDHGPLLWTCMLLFTRYPGLFPAD